MGEKKMKTGRFLKMQYEVEIQRVLAESQDALERVQEEVELHEIQKRVKVYKKETDGHLAVAFQPDGTIHFLITDRADYEQITDPEELKKFLEGCHLRMLKGTHPKRFYEVFMRASKKFLM